ncbi:MAG: glycosyltransferase family 9 protein [Chlamydiales bacterium]
MKERGNKWLKFWDRYLGIPLLFILGLFRKKRSLPKKIERIGLLKSAGIGDLVLLSGIIEDLKGKEVLLFTGESNREMGKMIQGVKVISLPITHPFSAMVKLRKHSVDIWIDCDSWPRISGLFTLFSRSKYTIGFKTQGQGRHWVYDLSIPYAFFHHEIENYRALIQPLAIVSKHPPRIIIRPTHSEKRVVAHMFSGGSKAHLKKWPEKYWKELILRMTHLGYQVDLTGDRSQYEALKRFSPEATNYAGAFSLRETAHHLKKCVCVISVDTGIMHLAAAIGCPVISLHGPTSPNRWGAKGEQVISLIPLMRYSPCIQLGFESKCRENRCLQALTVDQVFDAFIKITHGMTHENSYFSRRKWDASLASVSC